MTANHMESHELLCWNMQTRQQSCIIITLNLTLTLLYGGFHFCWIFFCSWISKYSHSQKCGESGRAEWKCCKRPKKISPFALNVLIKFSTPYFLIRLGAFYVYAREKQIKKTTTKAKNLSLWNCTNSLWRCCLKWDRKAFGGKINCFNQYISMVCKWAK